MISKIDWGYIYSLASNKWRELIFTRGESILVDFEPQPIYKS